MCKLAPLLFIDPLRIIGNPCLYLTLLHTSCTAHDISDFSFITCHSGQLEIEGDNHTTVGKINNFLDMKINPSTEFKSIPLRVLVRFPVATRYFILSKNLLIFPTVHFKFCIVLVYSSQKILSSVPVLQCSKVKSVKVNFGSKFSL